MTELTRGKGLRAGGLGLWANMTVGMASVAPAYSLAAAMAGLVAVAGVKVPAVFLLGFVPMMFIAFAFRELAHQTPDCGATFTWATRAFGPTVGWAGGWACVIAAIVGVGNGGQIAAIYLLRALGLNRLADSTVMQLAVGAAAVLILTVLSVRGIGVTGRVQQVLLVVQLGMLVLVSVVALGKVLSHHAGAQAVMPHWSWLSPVGLSSATIAHGAILCVFSYWGWDAGLSVAEETRDPRRNPGRAAVLSTVAMVGTYVLAAYGLQSFAGFATTGVGLNNPANANDALSVLGQPVLGRGLAVLLLLAICASALASTMTCVAPTARTMLAMSVYGALPPEFSTIHRRYRTPWVATVTVGAVGMVVYLAMTIISKNSLADMVQALGLATAFYYALTGYVCVWTFRGTVLHSARSFVLRGVLPLTGAAAMTWALVRSAIDMAAPDYGKTHIGPIGGVFAMGAGLLLLGLPVGALCAIRGRDYFAGRTLDAATTVLVPD